MKDHSFAELGLMANPVLDDGVCSVLLEVGVDELKVLICVLLPENLLHL
jgi:hypothetical protein